MTTPDTAPAAQAPLLRTPLHALALSQGARFGPFAGFDMPLQFSGVLKEHQAVRSAAGLFDVSHMGEVLIEGADAERLLQRLLTNNVGSLVQGAAMYTLMCTEAGGIIDDLIVYRESETRFMLCINASRRAGDVEHIQAQAKSFDVVATDVSDDFALLALQGRAAQDILSKLGCQSHVDMGSFRFVDIDLGAALGKIRIASTGYTGEPGYEIFCEPKHASALAERLLSIGEPLGLLPCGLASRDVLRLEMRYPLYGQDLSLDTSPIEAGLSWAVKLDRPEEAQCLGHAALVAAKAAAKERPLLRGIRMQGRGVPRSGYNVHLPGQNEVLSTLTSGGHSPSLGCGIALAYLPPGQRAIGQALEIDARGRRIPAEVVKTPFFSRK